MFAVRKPILNLAITVIAAIFLVIFAHDEDWMTQKTMSFFFFAFSLMCFAQDVEEASLLKVQVSKYSWKSRVINVLRDVQLLLILFALIEFDEGMDWTLYAMFTSIVIGISFIFMIPNVNFYQKRIQKILEFPRFDLERPIDKMRGGAFVVYGSVLAILILFVIQIRLEFFSPNGFFFVAIMLYSLGREYNFRVSFRDDWKQYWKDQGLWNLGFIALVLGFVISL